MIKIIMDNRYSFFVKYNVFKQKEFVGFDTHITSQVFYDKEFNEFILD